MNYRDAILSYIETIEVSTSAIRLYLKRAGEDLGTGGDVPSVGDLESRVKLLEQRVAEFGEWVVKHERT